jgi:hypothetical protein
MNRNRCLVCNEWHPYRLLCDRCIERLERGLGWAIVAAIPLGVGVLTWVVLKEVTR